MRKSPYSIDDTLISRWRKNKTIEPLKSQFLEKKWCSFLKPEKIIKWWAYCESYYFRVLWKIRKYFCEDLFLCLHPRTSKYIVDTIESDMMSNGISRHIPEKEYLDGETRKSLMKKMHDFWLYFHLLFFEIILWFRDTIIIDDENIFLVLLGISDNIHSQITSLNQLTIFFHYLLPRAENPLARTKIRLSILHLWSDIQSISIRNKIVWSRENLEKWSIFHRPQKQLRIGSKNESRLWWM